MNPDLNPAGAATPAPASTPTAPASSVPAYKPQQGKQRFGKSNKQRPVPTAPTSAPTAKP